MGPLAYGCRAWSSAGVRCRCRSGRRAALPVVLGLTCCQRGRRGLSVGAPGCPCGLPGVVPVGVVDNVSVCKVAGVAGGGKLSRVGSGGRCGYGQQMGRRAVGIRSGSRGLWQAGVGAGGRSLTGGRAGAWMVKNPSGGAGVCNDPGQDYAPKPKLSFCNDSKPGGCSVQGVRKVLQALYACVYQATLPLERLHRSIGQAWLLQSSYPAAKLLQSL